MSLRVVFRAAARMAFEDDRPKPPVQAHTAVDKTCI